jgi:transcription elongation factor Elf1
MKCPVCGSENMGSAGLNPVVGTVWCNSCGKRWSVKEWYTIHKN